MADTANSSRKLKRTGYVTRFTRSQRLEHLVLLVSFLMLALTGLAQKYYTAGWAEWLILNMGGIAYTRLIHRVFGAIFTFSAIYHLGFLIYAHLARKAWFSMLPGAQDFRNVVEEIRYSLGLSSQPPQFGRYDYRQKFEYWGIVFGGTIMIITGFVLAFPLTFTSFLPGQFVAACKEAHGNEAMLAVLTIVVWHLYDVMLKPGIFPADVSIFTGRISWHRQQKEHPLEHVEYLKAQDDTSAGEKN